MQPAPKKVHGLFSGDSVFLFVDFLSTNPPRSPTHFVCVPSQAAAKKSAAKRALQHMVGNAMAEMMTAEQLPLKPSK